MCVCASITIYCECYRACDLQSYECVTCERLLERLCAHIQLTPAVTAVHADAVETVCFQKEEAQVRTRNEKECLAEGTALTY